MVRMRMRVSEKRWASGFAFGEVVISVRVLNERSLFS